MTKLLALLLTGVATATSNPLWSQSELDSHMVKMATSNRQCDIWHREVHEGEHLNTKKLTRKASYALEAYKDHGCASIH